MLLHDSIVLGATIGSRVEGSHSNFQLVLEEAVSVQECPKRSEHLVLEVGDADAERLKDWCTVNKYSRIHFQTLSECYCSHTATCLSFVANDHSQSLLSFST